MMREGTNMTTGPERNIAAVIEFTNLTRSSLGPLGANKIIVNHLEKVFVTKDSATITQELEVQHPAAKVLVMAAQNQSQEFGDSTNLVLILAGELLAEAAQLIRKGVVPADIARGFEIAMTCALEKLEQSTVFTVDDVLDVTQLTKAVRTAIMAKEYGYEDLLSKLVAEACVTVMPRKDATKFNIDNVRIVKIMGQSVTDSTVMRGLVLQRDTEHSLKRVDRARVAVYSCGIEAVRAETKGTVLLHDADELLNFSKTEETQLKASIDGLKEAGINVVVSGSKIDDLALHYLEHAGIMAIRIPSKWELVRWARSLGANVMVKFDTPEPSAIGQADEVFVSEVGGRKCIIAQSAPSETRAGLCTIILRAATKGMLDDLGAAVSNGINVVQALTRDGRFVAGAGASEMTLAQAVEELANSFEGLEQYAIRQYGTALASIPKSLAETCGIPASKAVTMLRAAHTEGRSTVGINVEATGLADCLTEEETDIYDLLAGKAWAIRMATQAATTVLTVDQIIMSKQAGGPAPGGPEHGMPNGGQ
jgi:T-complex protein 1 subunit theta